MRCHSERAEEGCDGRRWLKRVRIWVWVGGMRRTRRPGKKKRGSQIIYFSALDVIDTECLKP